MALKPKVSVLDFFTSAKPIEKITVERGQTDGRCVFSSDATERRAVQSTRMHGLDYVKEFRDQLELEENSKEVNQPPPLMAELENPLVTPPVKSVLQVEGLSTLGVSRTAYEVDDDQITNVYSQYDFTPVQPKGLIIENLKDEILRMVESNQVVIIEGATGCGKSTQVPQYILDQHASRNLPCNIVVTQPRRIAATSIAKWVCQERKWNVGDVVGYQIGLELKHGPDTRLLFCTTGVLLEKLISLKDMNKFTHVILDEVHERNQDMDFLMLLVRRLLRTNSKNVKVILMSATFDTSRFSNYFGLQVNNMLVGAPIVDVKLRSSKYTTSEYFLDHLDKIPNLPEIDISNPAVTYEGQKLVRTLLGYFDKIDLEEFKRSHARRPEEGDHYRHCVLVFLPGLRDIEDMFNELGGEDNREKWLLLPLHSSLTRGEQQRVFEPVRIGFRKVVLCTDIAESSVTVPDVKYVIDFCLTKELIADPMTNFTSLQLRWASRTNCKQRAGRTGRVMNGRVYRLVPQNFYVDYLVEDKEPEMLRCPLEIVVLKCKILDIGEPRAVLSLALDPPDVSNIERAILLLKEAGGLLATCRGRPVRFDGDITFMGRVMACLPLNIQISKLVVLGYLFSLLDDMIVIAAMLSAQNVFTTPFQEQIKAYNSRLTWADGSCSDAVAYLNAYRVWQRHERTGFFKSKARNDKKYFQRYYINPKGLHEAKELVAEITSRLKDMNMIEPSLGVVAEWSKEEKPLILKTLIAGAFYPNYFLRGELGGQIDERDALVKVEGHDARRSVYLTGLPPDHPGLLYTKAVKNELKDCGSKMNVYFEANKYIVEFERFDGMAEEKNRKAEEEENHGSGTIPGGINMAVYRAVKRRISKLPVTIKIYRKHEANQLAEKHNLFQVPVFLRKSDSVSKETSNIPGPDENDIDFVVTKIDNPGRFWIQLVRHRGMIERIFKTLNDANNLCPLTQKVAEDDLVAAPFDGFYYRAKVLFIDVQNHVATVLFIDYGDTRSLPLSELRGVNDIPIALWNVPPYAIECRLRGIAPSAILNRNTIWSDKAIKYFHDRVNNALLKGKVYSRVDNTLVLDVKKIGGETSQQNNSSKESTFNEMLVREGFAVECVEDLRSRNDHEFREKLALKTDGYLPASTHRIYHREPKEVHDLPDPSGTSVVLKGPYSPLEMTVYGCMRSTSAKRIKIDPQSVNSVLLDSNPEDTHERLLVGAVVTQPGEGRNYLMIRNTTLMPNIPGLPPLMALLFSPSVELRMNIAETKYTGILCGLGYDPKDSSSLFPENDLCMTFDCVIDEEDLNHVNFIRHWMSHLLRTEEGEILPSVSHGEKREGQLKLKDYLRKLLMKRRQSQELSFDENMFEWNLVSLDKILVPVESDERYIFKLVRRPELTTQEEFVNHVQKLIELIKLSPDTPVNEACKLCNVRFKYVRDISTHINLQSHRNREAEEYDNLEE